VSGLTGCSFLMACRGACLSILRETQNLFSSAVRSLKSLLVQALYRLLMFEPVSFTLAQEVPMPPERWSHVPLKVFLKRPQPPVERNQVPPPFPGLVAGNAL
jgi:hypothetical protein